MSCEDYSTVPGCDLALRCVIYIFSSLVNTVKGAEKKYLKHQEVKSKRLVWAEKKKKKKKKSLYNY